jgi:hypothetical protein
MFSENLNPKENILEKRLNQIFNDEIRKDKKKRKNQTRENFN